MHKTKVLLVSSVDDYGNINFNTYNEVNNITNKDWVERLEALENKRISVEFEDEFGEILSFNVELFEFDEIDDNFVTFIRNEIQDYDFTKDIEFYIVKE